MSYALKWERNIWTGQDLLRLSNNERIIRDGGLYAACYWGNFSLEYPKYGPWRKTLAGARADMAGLKPNAREGGEGHYLEGE